MMASAWGSSWGTAWGAAWGTLVIPAPPSGSGGGGGGGLRELSKRFEKTLKAKLLQATKKPDTTPVVTQAILEAVWKDLADDGVISTAELLDKLGKLRREVEDLVLLTVLLES